MKKRYIAPTIDCVRLSSDVLFISTSGTDVDDSRASKAFESFPWDDEDPWEVAEILDK